MAKEIFLEIGSEEIPAGFLPKAMADLERMIRKELETARLEFGEVKAFATPRRLALSVSEVAEDAADPAHGSDGPGETDCL